MPRPLAALCLLLVGCGVEQTDAGPSYFATRVVSFSPGENAGYGSDRMPEIVLGAPRGSGENAGSLHVVSLGRQGELVLAFDDLVIVDGEGADLIVFENAFQGFVETGFVAVSEDGESWHEWPCDPGDEAGNFPGCAGVRSVFASQDNGVDARDPAVAGGDAFDLAVLGVSRARFVRIRDSGRNRYEATNGGFDLDAVAVVHAELTTR